MQTNEVETLYRTYAPAVLRRARAVLRNEAEAMEAMQDVFVTALTTGSGFRGTSDPMTWLYSVTTNLCLNRIRNTKRRAELLSDVDSALLGSAPPSPELHQLVRDLLETAPEEQARAAVYYYFDGLTHDEIGRLLDCSPRKVGYLLDRFREHTEPTAGVSTQ